jgi:putative acetyltransferase
MIMASPLITVRPARPGDIEPTALVALAAYRQAFAGILSPAALAARSAAGFAERFRAALDRLIVAEQDGIAGFLLMTDRHIDMLFVTPDRQGKGIGLALLRAAEATGARSLECFARNTGARAFYERAGWVLDQGYTRMFDGVAHEFVTYRFAPADAQALPQADG